MDFTLLRPRRVFAALEGYPDRPSIKTVERWCAGTSKPPQWAVDVIQARLGRQQESAPAWAEALADETVRKVIEAVTTPERLQQIETLIERLEELAPPPVEGSGDPSAEQDPVEPERPGRAAG